MKAFTPTVYSHQLGSTLILFVKEVERKKGNRATVLNRKIKN